MKRLLIATTNPAKLAEYRLLLRDFDLDAVSLADAGIREYPEENGANFEENALIKARFYFTRAQIPTIADDGGLEIDALGGEPGVRSHRWLGEGDNSDANLVAQVFRRMADIEQSRRSARLRAATALIYRDNGAILERVTDAAVEGIVAARPLAHIRPGFPYRSVLYLPDRDCYVGELGVEEEARVSQRRISIGRLAPDLKRIANLA